MEGCQNTLTLQRLYLLFWSIFSLLEGPQAAGYDGAHGTQPATLLLVLHPPAQHLPGTFASPETETQTSSYCFNTGTQKGSALALKHCLEKPWQAGKGLTNTQFKARIVTPPSQVPAARHTSCYMLFLSKNLCTCKPQHCRASGTWGGMCPTAQALPTQSRAGRQRIPALWLSPPHPR